MLLKTCYHIKTNILNFNLSFSFQKSIIQNQLSVVDQNTFQPSLTILDAPSISFTPNWLHTRHRYLNLPLHLHADERIFPTLDTFIMVDKLGSLAKEAHFKPKYAGINQQRGKISTQIIFSIFLDRWSRIFKIGVGFFFLSFSLVSFDGLCRLSVWKATIEMEELVDFFPFNFEVEENFEV